MKFVRQCAIIPLLGAMLTSSSHASNDQTAAIKDKSFFSVIETALITNPNILRTKASSAGEAYAITSVRGQYLPSIDLSSAIGREKTESASGASTVTLTRRENSLGVSQLIYDGNGVSSRYNQQIARYRSAQHAVNDSEESIAESAVSAYLDSIKTREIAKLAEDNEKEHVLTLSKVKELYAGGAGKKGDISLAEGRLASARATLVKLQNNIKDANATYYSVIGEELNYRLHWPEEPAARLPKSLDEAIKMAQNNSPALLSAIEQTNAASWGVKDAKSSFWPTFSFEFNTVRDNNVSGVKGNSNSMQVMLRGKWNLLRGGSDLAKYNQALQSVEEASENVARLRRQIVEQVTQGWNQWKSSLSRLEQLKKHMDTSKVVMSQYEEEFKYGQRQLFNLLDQKNEVFNAEVDYVNGRDEVVRTEFSLLARTGMLSHYIVEQSKKEQYQALELQRKKKMNQKKKA